MFMQRQIWLALVACAGAIAASGCMSLSDEGGADYRKAQPANADQVKAFNTVIQGSSSTTPAASAPVLLTPLLRKDMELPGDGAAIAKLDKVSIRLRDGFLKDCNETWRSPRRNFDKNCEIGILFRTFELGEGNDFNFKPGAEREARLVYFSHDVRPGQFFNLHNLPVYGPIEFHGRPLGIDTFIIEIDAEDQQAFAVFKSLASAGAKAFAPAAPILGLLDGLGSSLLNSGTDDVQYRYSFVLDPSGGYKGTVYATAEAGDYVFIRTQNRDLQVEWKDLFLDHNTGRVWTTRNGTAELFRDHTYLSVQVLKNAGSEDVSLAQNTYGDFRDALEHDATEKASKLATGLQPILEAAALKRVQVRAFNDAQKKFERMVADCDGSQEGWQRTAFDLLQQTKESVNGLSCAPAAGARPVATDLSQAQVDYLLKRMRDRSKAQTEAQLDAFNLGCNTKYGAMDFPAFATLMCPAVPSTPAAPATPEAPANTPSEAPSETPAEPAPETPAEPAADPPG